MAGSTTTSQPVQSKKLAVAGLLAATIVPILTAYIIVFQQAAPAPLQDDYHAILDFALQFKQSAGWIPKSLWIVSAQHDEYKLIFEHALIALEVVLTGHVNFLLLDAAGNLFLLPIGFLLCLTFSDRQRSIQGRLWQFLPVSLIFFSLTYWQTLDWAMTGLQNLPVILFSFLAIYLLAGRSPTGPSGKVVGLAIVSAALASLSSANGFLMAPIGLAILLRQQRKIPALIWSLSFTAPLAMYLFHYNSVPLSISTHHLFYLEIPLQFFAFLGSAFAPFGIAVVLGLAIFIVILASSRSRRSLLESDPVAFYLLMFILGSAAMVALGRGPHALSAASRYAIYSNLAIICCYSLLVRDVSDRELQSASGWVFLATLTFALVFCIAGDLRGERNLVVRRRLMLDGIEHYRASSKTSSPLNDPVFMRMMEEGEGNNARKEEDYERLVLTRALQSGLYTLPRGKFENQEGRPQITLPREDEN